MRRIKPLIFLLPSVIAPLAITGCSCNSNKDKTLYVAIPKEYLHLTNNETVLEGINSDKASTALSSYNTLQVPAKITKIIKFAPDDEAAKPQVAYDCIKYIVFSDASCKSIGDDENIGFSNLKNCEKITFPSSLTTLGISAFSQLPKLTTIDASALDSIKCFKSEDVFMDMPSNGTFYTKNKAQADALTTFFKDGTKGLKNWTFKTK